MAIDLYAHGLEKREEITHPSEDAFVVTPDDDSDLEYVTRALYVGTGGDLKVTLYGINGRNGRTLTFTVADGTGLPLRVTHVHATGTTATDILALV